MLEKNIILPKKIEKVSEEGNRAEFKIENLYPGYGHTLGNSLRRIILSSISGTAVTSVKIKGVDHEFSTISGVFEDVINIVLNLKKTIFKLHTEENEVVLTLKKSASGKIYSKDIEIPTQVEIINPENYLCEITDKAKEIEMEIVVSKGLGYVAKEDIQKEKVQPGKIIMDTAFTPIRKVSYDVQNMRVGDRTDFNKIILKVETDGTYTPEEVIDKSLEIMLEQISSIRSGAPFSEEDIFKNIDKDNILKQKINEEVLDLEIDKKIDDFPLSESIISKLQSIGLDTLEKVKNASDNEILSISGFGQKALDEIRKILR